MYTTTCSLCALTATWLNVKSRPVVFDRIGLPGSKVKTSLSSAKD